MYFELLQFADYIILISDGSWNNLLTIKSMSRGFEMAPGLCVNLRQEAYFTKGTEMFKVKW